MRMTAGRAGGKERGTRMGMIENERQGEREEEVQ